MRKARLTAFVAAGIVAASLSARAGGSRFQEIPVTTVIADMAAESPLRVQSDRQGAYVTKTVNKVTQVRSILITNMNGHDWDLTTYYSTRSGYAASNRKVFFDLREQVTAGAFATPFLGADAYGAPADYGQLTAHLIAKCSRNNVDMVKMAAGASALCPGSFRFRAPDGTWYRLSFAPENYAHVNPFKVTCTTADTTGCKTWTIEPSGTAVTAADPNPRSLNKLLLIDEGGNVLAEGGDYLLSFSITVVR